MNIQIRSHIPHYRSRAFTLIELLVVIAIIAILAAILFPVFATAREKARASSCTSNLKQLGIAFLQYEQDYDELNPHGRDGGTTGWQGDGWAFCIYPYVKSKGVFTCPDDTYNVQSNSTAPSDAIISYAENTQIQSIAMTKATAPAKLVQLIEISGVQAAVGVSNSGCWNNSWGLAFDYSCATYQFSPGTEGYGIWCGSHPGNPHFMTGYLGGRGGNCSYCATNTDGTLQNNSPTGWHSNGANYLMADGHVKWLMGNLVSSGTVAPSSTYAQGIQNAAGAEVSTFAVTFSPV